MIGWGKGRGMASNVPPLAKMLSDTGELHCPECLGRLSVVSTDSNMARSEFGLTLGFLCVDEGKTFELLVRADSWPGVHIEMEWT